MSVDGAAVESIPANADQGLIHLTLSLPSAKISIHLTLFHSFLPNQYTCQLPRQQKKANPRQHHVFEFASLPKLTGHCVSAAQHCSSLAHK